MSQIRGGMREWMMIEEQIRTEAARMELASLFATESTVVRIGSNPLGSILCSMGMLTFPLRRRIQNR